MLVNSQKVEHFTRMYIMFFDETDIGSIFLTIKILCYAMITRSGPKSWNTIFEFIGMLTIRPT